MVVVAQTACLVIDDLAQALDLVAHRQHLVDLLLVLAHGENHAGMIEDIDHLLGNRVGIDGNRNATQCLHGCKGPVQPGTVLADDCHLVARLQPEFGQAQRIGGYLVPEFGP